MDVVIVGGHGKIARHLGRLLAERGDTARGLIRNPDHAEDLRADGVEPVVADVESSDGQQLAGAFRGAGAAVFAAGAGPGSGRKRKWTVDHGAVVKTIDACRHAGIDRLVVVSSIGIDEVPGPEEEGDDEAGVWNAYKRAKAQADADVRASGLDYTIVRPGLLTDGEATGRVRLERHVERGPITRADVARVLLAVLDDPATSHRTFEAVGGLDGILEAVANLAGKPETDDRENLQG